MLSRETHNCPQCRWQSVKQPHGNSTTCFKRCEWGVLRIEHITLQSLCVPDGGSKVPHSDGGGEDWLKNYILCWTFLRRELMAVPRKWNESIVEGMHKHNICLSTTYLIIQPCKRIGWKEWSSGRLSPFKKGHGNAFTTINLTGQEITNSYEKTGDEIMIKPINYIFSYM